MLKNKKAIYILLPLVLIIWGALIWRIFNMSSNDEEVAYIPPVSNPKKIQDSDSVFTISVNYRDPFLGNMASSVANSGQNADKQKSKVKLSKPVVKYENWPTIEFLGVIKNKVVKKEVYTLSINNTLYMAELGKVYDKVVLVSFRKDSVQVVFNKKSRFIRLSK